ncbi:hypothetical protein HMPREF9296_1416 [Prevotella disiens FB035-09AN]|uniref:Uncharacterized protein n=1 Tax=Prevotella disiens FB035-09AN TaxID=866771 RepID=E1KRV7_9BACT|nr:hypothetical protein HMPREF9296_1416 [Prevotella disiens FB035-09AN]
MLLAFTLLLIAATFAAISAFTLATLLVLCAIAAAFFLAIIATLLLAFTLLLIAATFATFHFMLTHWLDDTITVWASYDFSIFCIEF